MKTILYRENDLGWFKKDSDTSRKFFALTGDKIQKFKNLQNDFLFECVQMNCEKFKISTVGFRSFSQKNVQKEPNFSIFHFLRKFNKFTKLSTLKKSKLELHIMRCAYFCFSCRKLPEKRSNGFLRFQPLLYVAKTMLAAVQPVRRCYTEKRCRS